MLLHCAVLRLSPLLRLRWAVCSGCLAFPASRLTLLASQVPHCLALPVCLQYPQSLTTSSSTDWSQASSQQRALDAALKGLPGPEALEQLRSMSLEQAVQFYNR